MMDLDLNKAYEAARDEVAGYTIGTGYYSQTLCTDEAEELARAAVDGALVPILEALAAKAEAERERFTDWPAGFLRALAEEARR